MGKVKRAHHAAIVGHAALCPTYTLFDRKPFRGYARDGLGRSCKEILYSCRKRETPTILLTSANWFEWSENAMRGKVGSNSGQVQDHFEEFLGMVDIAFGCGQKKVGEGNDAES